jgi:hypothetical protein
VHVNNAARRAVLVLALVVAGSVVAGAPGVASPLVPRSTAQPATPQPGPLAITPPQPANLTPLDSGFGPTTVQKQAMAQAATAARASGKPAVVSGLTSETQQVLAQPRGGFALEANPQPVRTQQRGSWVPVDTTLHRNPDGTWSPAATAYGTVRFSGGGGHPLAATTSGTTTYAMSWPTALPTPAVSGATATYANVLPGVDLQVSATVAGGFSDVLVVHTAQAAHNPALTRLALATTVTGGHATAGPHGTITVTGAPGENTLTAATPLMWDSNTTLTTPTGKNAPHMPAGITVKPDNSDAVHPGLAAHLGVVSTKVSASGVDLVPDPQLLTGRATVYPLYIDPSFGWHPTTGGTPAFDEVKQGAPCTNTSFFDNTGSAGDGGNLGVGYNNWDSCFGVMRSFYQWQLPSVIWGAHIGNVTGQPGATVNINKTYSAACVTSAEYLHWSGGIGPGTSWNSQPGLGSLIGTIPNLGHTGACPGFGSTVPGSFDVTSQIAASAASHASQFTVALTGNEARGNVEFSRFAHAPTLQIYFNHIPNAPGANQMAAVTGSDNAGCATATPYPYVGKTIATNTPVLNASVSDPDIVDHLQANYQYWIDGSTTKTTANSADNLTTGSTARYSLPSSFTTSLANGQVVDWQVRVTDGADWSGWSPICHFIAEPTAPPAPTITSTDGRYPGTGVTGATAGTPGRFGLTTPTPTGGATTKIVYGLDQPPATSNPPASATTPLNGGGVATAAGRWKLNDGTGTSAADVVGNHTAQLSSGASWTNDATRGAALSFNGTSGYATSPATLSTATSMSVSAWVKLASSGDYQAVVTQTGTQNSNMDLGWFPTFGGWAFIFKNQNNNVNGLSQYSYASYNPTTSPVGVWTHIAGTFDAANGSMALYVNGTKVAIATDATPWAANGLFTVGAYDVPGVGISDYLNGTVSDVQTYPSTLSGNEIAQIYGSSTLNVTPPSPGPHSLSAYAADAAGDVSGYQTYPFVAAADPNTTCASLAACFNNTAISPDNNPGLAAVDGSNSFSANDLTNAGWNSGSKVTVNGATFTVPQYGTGQADNILAANQTVTYNQAVPATGGSALEFLAASTNAKTATVGAIPGDNTAPYVPTGTAVAGTYCFDATNPAAYCAPHGTINYSDAAPQPFFLTVPDWIVGPEPLAAIQLPHENTPAGQVSRVAMMFPFSVPLEAGKTVVSVTLPDVGTTASPTSPALHIFGIATRNTTTNTDMTTTGVNGNNTTTSTLSAGQTWTGAWAAPTEGVFNYGYTFSNQTFREAIKPSLAGNSIRVKFDDSLGINPIQIAHATIALSAGGGSPSPVTTAAPVDLVFGANQNKAVTVPEGGMVYSNPLPFTVPAGQYVLVSFQMTNSVQWLVTHTDTTGIAYQYTPGAGTGDKTTDTTGTAFLNNGPGGPSTNVVTGLDVQTNGTATLAVLGDGFIDQANTGRRPTATNDLANNLTDAEPTTPSGYGTLAEGIESNQIMTDYPEHNGSGPAALSRIDRDILDQPNITTVVINEGLEDTLNATNTTQDLTANGYTQLINYLLSANIAIIAIGQTPCDGYAGDGVTPNDPCTAAVDQKRTMDNTWLSAGPFGLAAPAYFYLNPDTAIGVPDTGNGETTLNSAADAGDHVNLTDAGYGALTNAYLGAQDTWALNDGTDATQVGDAGDNATSYLFNNLMAGNNPATLTGTTTWTTDPTHNTVMTLDGATSQATTAGPVLTTTGSFSVSAWAQLSSTSHNADIVTQDATTTSGFALQYDAADNRWAFTMATSDTTLVRALSGTAPTTGTWTHLVGTYNATTHTLSLYVNGTLATTTTNITPVNATGPLAIGRGQSNATPTDYFPGSLSTIQAWNYTLTPIQIAALYQQIN